MIMHEGLDITAVLASGSHMLGQHCESISNIAILSSKAFLYRIKYPLVSHYPICRHCTALRMSLPATHYTMHHHLEKFQKFPICHLSECETASCRTLLCAVSLLRN